VLLKVVSIIVLILKNIDYISLGYIGHYNTLWQLHIMNKNSISRAQVTILMARRLTPKNEMEGVRWAPHRQDMKHLEQREEINIHIGAFQPTNSPTLSYHYRLTRIIR